MQKAENIVPRDIIQIPFSPIREMMACAASIEKGGESVVHLEIGRPDFDTPKHIKDAATDAMRNGHVHYTSNYGILPLRRAISSKLKSEQSLEYDPETEVIATVGAAEAISTALQTICAPGDGLLIPTPAFVNYLNLPPMMNLQIQEVPLLEEDRFELNPKELERKIRPNSKGLILVSPHNPTGSMVSEKKLEAIARICIRNNLIVFADEVYEKILYRGHRFRSIATLPKMWERTLLINSFSKTYSMTGWRLGYIAGPRPLMDQIIKVHQYKVTSTCSFVQYGGLAALEGPQGCVVKMVEEFQRRRDFLVNALGQIGMPCETPPGAFYLFPRVSHFRLSSKEFAMFLLEKAKVVTVPGSAFGAAGEGYIRFSYANSMDNLERATAAMGEAMKSLNA